MSRDFEIEAVEWQPVRPEMTQGIWGRTLLDEQVKVVLTRVAPMGKFSRHRDKYSHLFYFLSGEGIVRVDGKEIAAHPGVVIRIAAGEDHAYENTGHDDLILMSLNLP